MILYSVYNISSSFRESFSPILCKNPNSKYVLLVSSAKSPINEIIHFLEKYLYTIKYFAYLLKIVCMPSVLGPRGLSSRSSPAVLLEGSARLFLNRLRAFVLGGLTPLSFAMPPAAPSSFPLASPEAG